VPRHADRADDAGVQQREIFGGEFHHCGFAVFPTC
jgi:hypothetical protein